MPSRLGNMPPDCGYTSLKVLHCYLMQWSGLRVAKGIPVLIHINPVNLYICGFCN